MSEALKAINEDGWGSMRFCRCAIISRAPYEKRRTCEGLPRVRLHHNKFE